MAEKLTVLDGTKEEGIEATKKLFGLSSDQSFQDLEDEEDSEE